MQKQKVLQTTDQNQSEKKMVVMGHVIGPFGVRGCIKVRPYTEYIDSLLDYSVWWLGDKDGGWRKIRVIAGHVSGNTLTIELENYHNRTLAEPLKGLQVAIPRSQLPDLAENGESGYYWSDLIDSSVVNLKAEKLGKVIGLLETGANDVLQVQDPDADNKERLIPFIDQVVMKVDLQSKQITVDWGMDY